MSDFEVNVVRVDSVEKHPNADRLDIVRIGGYLTISAKLEDGSPRYKEGDLVVYIPENSILPDWLLKKLDLWDVNKNRGALSNGGNRLRPKKLRGIFSEGILYPVDVDPEDGFCSITYSIPIENGIQIHQNDEPLTEGDDVAEFLGITKWEPQVPVSMMGQMSGEYINFTVKYDFESIKKHWNMFEEEEYVFVTEKIHGTCIQIGYVPGLNDPMLFGETGSIYVTSKGVGARGFIYKNLEANKDNLYCTTLTQLLEQGLEEKLRDYVAGYNMYRTPEEGEVKTVHLFGEIYGGNIQDLNYGAKTPEVRFFDIAVDKQYLDPFMFFSTAKYVFEVPVVPDLYRGPFNKDEIMKLVDGKDFSNSHIREGIVIKGVRQHPHYGRKIAKWVSEDYLLRKGGTEYQ